MATKKKLLQAAAGNAGGAGPDVTDVFSTYLYTGNGSTQTITNGVDLDGDGGLVWIKSRSDSRNNLLFDTERGATYYLRSNTTDGTLENAITLSSFNSDGFNIESAADVNRSTATLASWSWRKAPKFFDVQTYTGNGTTQTISHNLGATVGTLIVKKTSGTENWQVYHRSLSVSNQEYLQLNLTSAVSTNGRYLFGNNTIMVAPTSTQFTLGQSAGTNENGATYVAYIFAHNDGDGEFGPDGDQDIIKCGSFTTDGSGAATVNLGWEPQWVLSKSSTSSADDWEILDIARGWGMGNSAKLSPNTSNQEYPTYYGANTAYPEPRGFTNKGLYSNQTYIYMAIRRGPLAPPEAGTEVFKTNDVDNGASAPDSLSGFPVDMYFRRYVNTTNDTYLLSRLTGTGAMKTNGTDAEVSFSTASAGFDYNNGVMNIFSTNNADFHTWMWKRAPGFFDVVAYTGNGTAGRTVSHNLGVAPEMMIVKRRASGASSWTTYVLALGATKYLRVNNTNAAATSSLFWNNTSPTDSVFTLGSDADVNGSSGETYIAYLFATLAGISKVGSYTGTGAAQNIDCGFTTGARFILLKNTSGTGNWYLFDSARGIVAGNDPYLYLNLTNAEVTSRDGVDPLSSGFTLTTDVTFNASGATYIFYAIA